MFGKNLIVIATCDPYDFLEEKEEIRNYITIYEPTVSAFKSAVDVIFGVTKAVGTLPVGHGPITSSQSSIRLFKGSEVEIDHIWELWNKIFLTWTIERERLAKILSLDPQIPQSGHHFLEDRGFCLSFVSGGKAKISVVGVLPEHRAKGIGTSLVNRAVCELKVTTTGPLSLSIGSDFPRFWPGVPGNFPQEAKNFFLHRGNSYHLSVLPRRHTFGLISKGFRKTNEPASRDFYRSIKTEITPPAVLERVAKLPLTYSPWSPAMYEECMTKQRANFSNNQSWIMTYEHLAATNQHHEVMVAFDESGAQVGWTLMCSPSATLCQYFAFLPLLPSKEKTGLIACVGVDKKARGKGVGLGLMVAAMDNMRDRGIEGVLIDWVVIRGFYETLGYEVFWEYENYEL